ncbi:receptor-like protein EIX2 [Daucus carota subsp. sativus]|uniref:receptor-like protein EIX2 n=1 Tax=Daucus carota subsp. sativus TaxID=79200 RepID=UPI0007EF140E|nr:PREDICTED: leucine-rich repeat receptor protein kinase EMS1-like [Daucus carota subsp. sativus]
MAMRNAMHVWFLVFGMLSMETILASSELESNKTMVNNNIKCIETERLALLDIKRGLVSTLRGLSSWGSNKDEKNCCQWSSVECDLNTGHVTHLRLSFLSYRYVHGEPTASNISSSLLLLRNLQYLDLSYNIFDISFLSSIGSLTNLVHLDLSSSQFQGAIPDELGNLSKLSYLDFSDNIFGISIPSFIGSLTNLVHLDLSSSGFQGAIPDELGNLSQLSYLDLSYNQLEGMVPNSFHSLSSLQTVDFTSNKLTGNLQDLFYLLPKAKATLQTLLISENQLTGSLPDITAFSFLTELNVQSNQLNGFLPKKFEHKSVLEALSLSDNHLQGSLPNFSGFSFLKYLNLNDNKFSGSLPDFDGCSALESLHLRGNQLTGWETQSIGQLTNLVQLDLSRNSINSTINEHHLSELYNLYQMNASFNSLTFNMSSDWLAPFKLDHLSLASCRLGPKFPIWIRNQTKISILDFSSTQISDTIPMWFWDNFTRISILDLSSNKISGTLSSIPLHIDVINLSSNYFEGPLPLISPLCLEINLSHNNFSGKLVLSKAEVFGLSLRFLDLSHNLLFGEIPDSWKNFEDLIFLNLGNNNFSGRIPMSIRYLHSLNKLILRNNRLDGELPESLRNCTNLGFVDFGLNGLSGTVPAWIGQDLPQLYALVLKSNKFYGSLPDDLCHLSHLHFLDLSMNRLSGNVPQCFSSLIAMTNNGTRTKDHHNNRILSASPYSNSPYHSGCSAITRCRRNGGDSSYLDEAFAGWKGKEREYRGNFAYLKMIDLSSNKFTGGFPTGITRLLDLRGLNLSRNQFYGKVPLQIGRLFQLEVLDLSGNKFSGDIPRNISGLTFLAYLDLSSNNFSGRIPLGGQLQTFNSSMYEGNPGLCGLPLTKRCPGDETSVEVLPPSNGNEVDEDEILYERWLYISAALGFSTSFWGICVTLLVNRRWRHAYFLFLTKLKDQLYVLVAVRIARLKVRLQG